MKKTFFKSTALFAIIVLTIASSCKKEEVLPGFTPSSTTVAIGEPVTFTDKETLRTNRSFTWDFGDGTSSHDRNPSHVYTKAGAYIVSQTVSIEENTEEGQNTKESSVSTVTVTAPVANFTTTQATYAKGDGIVFTNTSTYGTAGSAIRYEWSLTGSTGVTASFGNNAINPAITIDAPGVYTITLVATQGQTSSVKTSVITINGTAANASAANRLAIEGDWSAMTYKATTSGVTAGNNCSYANGINDQSIIDLTKLTFNANGSVTVFKKTGDQTNGTSNGSWSLSADGKFMTYGFETFKIKTTSPLVLENVNIINSNCGIVTISKVVTFTK